MYDFLTSAVWHAFVGAACLFFAFQADKPGTSHLIVAALGGSNLALAVVRLHENVRDIRRRFDKPDDFEDLKQLLGRIRNTKPVDED